ncbi:MAG: DUF5011 domain-containing protein [Bacilli bacterium]|nr:DUF5011 domain-containing protein [Bacilli bacterium]
MKKIVYISTFVIVLLISFLSVTYSYEYNNYESLKFELIGPAKLYVDVNSEYHEYGIKVIKDGNDISSSVKIDRSSVNMNQLGEYKVKYELDVDGNKEYIYRDIFVVDISSPKIELKGDSLIYVLLGGSYIEEGYTVNDNYDTSVEVDIIGGVNTNKEGKYQLEYRATDDSGNVGTVTRKVIVKKPEVTLADISGNRFTISSYDINNYPNTITLNNWTSNGVYYEGYMKDKASSYKIKLKNKDNSLEYIYNMVLKKNNYYMGNLDLTLLPNGDYLVYIIGNKEEKLLNKLGGLTRLLRAKVGNKLVSFSYDNDYVNISISDFKYEYDIVIDPGHGGSDNGASNGIVLEKNMNLKQSLYEKCRYESMGYKVYMTRYDDTYGEMLGSNSLDILQRRSLVMGYYGALARVAYSNHHNASVNSGAHGFEILVSNKLSFSDLTLELSLYNKYKKYYNIGNSSTRLYSRDYNSGSIFNKLNGNIYSNTDYYAIIRIPMELFNVKTVIYEPIYISNSNDFSWYWLNKKWVDVTEIKIKEYVNYLGGTYNSDNSMCL